MNLDSRMKVVALAALFLIVSFILKHISYTFVIVFVFYSILRILAIIRWFVCDDQTWPFDVLLLLLLLLNIIGVNLLIIFHLIDTHYILSFNFLL